MSTNNDPLVQAISDNNLPELRTLLESQDHQLFSQTARTGTPETAAYLLSRFPIPEAKYAKHVVTPHPTLNPTQYLARESARNGNAPLFRYLLTQYPSLLSTVNNDSRNVESILVNAMDGGLSIWKIILEHDAGWKDYEFSGHYGCVLEIVVEFGKIDLLEMLLREGADTDRAGDPVLELARVRGAGKEMLELIKKYSG